MCKFRCRICGRWQEQKYRSLFQWSIPLSADIREQSVSCKRYPIEPVVCMACGHVQLKETLKIDMYDNYLYTPSFSKGFQEYIAEFVDYIDRMDGAEGKHVVEIGSSNGYLLKQMQNKGWSVLGFEPSAILADEAEKNGVHTEKMYFGSDDSLYSIKKWGTPNVVIMRHVMEHLDDLNGIVEAISSILNEGFLIIEVPWLLRIIKEKQFYAFFHEHLSYFSVTIIQKLLQKYDFNITDIKENDLEGGSIVVYAYRGNTLNYDSNKIIRYLELEKEWCSVEKIVDFSVEVKQQIDKIIDLIAAEKKRGKKVAAWGAGQRGVTLLNICGLNQMDIDYIIDVNENYWWKYVLGASIQIVPPSWLIDHYVDSIIILATGYADEIILENNDYLSRGGRFLKIIEDTTE